MNADPHAVPRATARRPRLLLVPSASTKREPPVADELPLADPRKAYWTIADVAAYLGIKEETVRTYRKRGWLPKEDDKFGQSPVWKPETIINFKRPGQGARTDLKGDQ